MSEQQQITQEQYVNFAKIDSLAKQNAQQAVRIADLEAQLGLIQAQQQQPSEDGDADAAEAEVVPEAPEFEEVEDAH